MYNIKRIIVVGLLLLLVLSNTACNLNLGKLTEINKTSAKPTLMKAEIHFTDTNQLTCYIQSLGVEEDGQVYIGGASVNYIYDKDGKIIGSYNYQRVDYIKILTE